jgi:hypothetical protein
MQDTEQMTDQLMTDLNQIVQRGRDEADHILGILADSARSTNRNQRIAAGVVLASLAVGVGVLMYRQRRHRPFIARLPGSLPGPIRDLPGDVRDLARKASR